MKFFIALDQGTSSSRALLFNEDLEVLDSFQINYDCIFPKTGWVEQLPNEILVTQLDALKGLVNNNYKVLIDSIDIGITNQRESFVLWNSSTGTPVYNSINWQDKRTDDYCREIQGTEFEKTIVEKTGLIVNSYFSATKVKWVIENISDAKKLLEEGNLMFGTIDTWLLYNLTNGECFYTDSSNASRTMLFNIHSNEWDIELLEYFSLSKLNLPTVLNTIDTFGSFTIEDFPNIKFNVRVVIGDQQSALYAQDCVNVGDAKITFGTGCFALLNAGKDVKEIPNGIIKTIAWRLNNTSIYALEGSAFSAGSMIKWLKESLELLNSYDQLENVLNNHFNNEVYVIPAFVGLGSPYWNSEVRASIFGLDFSTTKEDLIYAVVKSIAYQANDILQVMKNVSGFSLDTIKVDGGITSSEAFLQLLANVTELKVTRSETVEATAMGVAKLLISHRTTSKMSEDLNSRVYLPIPGYSANQYKNWHSVLLKTLDISTSKF